MLFNYGYDRLPDNVPDADSVTLMSYVGHSYYRRGNEGFAWGIKNNEGYNNLYDYERGMSIDVLVMGSSHMEALNVAMNESMPAVLGEMSGLRVYNVGFSGYLFNSCVKTVQKAAEKYCPSKYLIMETFNVSFSDDEFREMLSPELPKIYVPQRNILRRFFRHNTILMKAWIAIKYNFISPEKRSQLTNPPSNNPELLAQVLARIKRAADFSGARAIIAYHPYITIHEDGSITLNVIPEAVNQFRALCEENGIYFVDAGQRFLDEYAKNYTLPYGFINTSAGSGHLNRYGHRMFAEEIYKLMKEIEAES